MVRVSGIIVFSLELHLLALLISLPNHLLIIGNSMEKGWWSLFPYDERLHEPSVFHLLNHFGTDPRCVFKKLKNIPAMERRLRDSSACAICSSASSPRLTSRIQICWKSSPVCWGYAWERTRKRKLLNHYYNPFEYRIEIKRRPLKSFHSEI